MNRRKLVAFGVAIALWAVYTTIIVLAALKGGGQRLYGLDPRQLFVMRLTVSACYFFNWLAGAYCVVALLATADLIPTARDKFRKIAWGFVALQFGTMAGSIVAASRSLFPGDQVMLPALTMSYNWLSAFTTLVGAWFIFRGGTNMAELVDRGAVPPRWRAAAALTLVFLVVTHLWIAFANPDRTVSTVPNGVAVYYLSDMMIALTLSVPYIVGFSLAVLSAERIAQYFVNRKGFIYQKAGKLFMVGYYMVLLGFTSTVFAQSLGSARAAKIGVIGIFGLLWTALILHTVGYIVVALGIRTLIGVETVLYKSGDGEVKTKKKEAPFPTA